MGGGFFMIVGPGVMNYQGLWEQECRDILNSFSKEYFTFECSPKSWPQYPGWDPRYSPYGSQGEWVSGWEQEWASAYTVTSQNRYIQAEAFDTAESTKHFADTIEVLVKAMPTNSELFSTLYIAFNYALGGGSDQALRGFTDTSVHPQVNTAVATLKVEQFLKSYFPDEHANLPEAREYINYSKLLQQTMDDLLGADAGGYINEASYEQPNWQTIFFGKENYDSLVKAKQRYDPSGLFVCHHCVGSDMWTSNGNCRIDTAVDNIIV